MGENKSVSKKTIEPLWWQRPYHTHFCTLQWEQTPWVSLQWRENTSPFNCNAPLMTSDFVSVQRDEICDCSQKLTDARIANFEIGALKSLRFQAKAWCEFHNDILIFIKARDRFSLTRGRSSTQAILVLPVFVRALKFSSEVEDSLFWNRIAANWFEIQGSVWTWLSVW